MSVKVFSCMVQGLEAKLIEVEADILKGMPAFSIVGLGDVAVQEAKERIHSAIKNSDANYPQQKKIINLAPAHLKKNGPYFDLPMAVGLLAASKQVEIPKEALFVGELALDGQVRPISGVLSIAMYAKAHHWQKLFLPAANAWEAALIGGIEIYPVESLKKLIRHLQGDILLQTYVMHESLLDKIPPEYEVDFSWIQGQESGKRALEIAASSNHHILLFGSPGVGKTLLAKALASILPPLSDQEFLEVMQVYSCAGLLTQKRLHTGIRPFRQVHHSASQVALTGGGTPIHPGEISLSHHGVLFLDEIAEFPRTHIDALRTPLEEKEIYISRSSGTVKYPANFTLVAAMNPCPCGYYGDPQKSCQCSASQILQYQKKISGPVQDRLDLNVCIPRQPLEVFEQNSKTNIHSKDIRDRVIQVRNIQQNRFKTEHIKLNSQMGPSHLKKYCPLKPEVQKFIFEACEKLTLSARAYHQLLKVSRTIADLNGNENIGIEDFSEALQYRQRSG